MEKKLITEVKFMMERLENPRMTYTEYEKRHKILTEDQDPVDSNSLEARRQRSREAGEKMKSSIKKPEYEFIGKIGKKYYITSLQDFYRYIPELRDIHLSNIVKDLFVQNGNKLTLYSPKDENNNKIIELGGDLYEVNKKEREFIKIDQLPSWVTGISENYDNEN